MKVTSAFAALAAAAARRGARTVILPEKIAVTEPAWTAVDATLRVALQDHSRIVVGFQDDSTVSQNVALIFEADGRMERYAKQRLIAGFEPLVPGNVPGLLGNGRAVAICKDMNYQGLIRRDVAGRGVSIVFVPAWDFVKDRATHANMAVMRGVEDGFAVVRAARQGLMTISDAQGRILASAASKPDSPVVLVAGVPPGRGTTVYAAIGDAFAWCCGGLTLALAFGIISTCGRRTEKRYLKRTLEP